MKRLFATAAAVVLAAALGACAELPDRGGRAVVGEQSARYGVVGEIEQVQLDNDHQFGIGTVAGAAAGGLLGHQIGGGSGRDVATVLGVIGGGIAGNAVQNRVDRRPGERILVRLENGASITVTQPGTSQLRVGDRVVIHGDGRGARVERG